MQRPQTELDALDALFSEYGRSKPSPPSSAQRDMPSVSDDQSAVAPAADSAPSLKERPRPNRPPSFEYRTAEVGLSFLERENRRWGTLSDWLPVLFAILAVVCFWWALPQGSTNSDRQTNVAHAPRLLLPAKPIREIQLGDRIQGRNPLREQVEDFEPDSATWRHIHLQMHKDAGGSLTIELLRPIEWIEDHAAQPGSTIHLDLHEMGAVGEATVIAINDCPPIEPGSGTVVTGKFVHQCGPGTKLVHLRIAGQSEPTGVTDNHPYWSVDRHDFIPAGELRVGELVDTELGAKRVQSVEFWTGFDGLLYNLETTEHVFRVGSLGTLVHNTCDLHHTIPKEIQNKLPPHLRSDPDIIGRKGLPNRLSVESGHHRKVVHDKTDISSKASGIFGGAYNKRFHDEILKAAGSYKKVTKEQVLRIRDLLVQEFDL